jgi:hypothetical protein
MYDRHSITYFPTKLAKKIVVDVYVFYKDYCYMYFHTMQIITRSLWLLRQDYGLDDRNSIPGRDRDFSLCHHVQTDLAPTASCPVRTRRSFRGGKVSGASLLSSAEVKNARRVIKV